MIVFPNAKINLGLRITSKRSDGYHNLQTIFYPVPLEDALEVTPCKEAGASYSFHQSGLEIGGAQEDNLVTKAYRLLAASHPLPPVEVYLHKNIPAGAGLGGGSADAAFMINLLDELFCLHLGVEEREAYAAKLGADCAFFIQDKPTLATGIGNIFTPLSLSLQGYRLLLVKPRIFVSTKEAFSQVRPAEPQESLSRLIASPIEEWRHLIVNDFEKSVFALHPELAVLKEKMYVNGALYASMSGSGSSVYGIFPAEAQLSEKDYGEESRVYNLML